MANAGEKFMKGIAQGTQMVGKANMAFPLNPDHKIGGPVRPMDGNQPQKPKKEC